MNSDIPIMSGIGIYDCSVRLNDSSTVLEGGTDRKERGMEQRRYADTQREGRHCTGSMPRSDSSII